MRKFALVIESMIDHVAIAVRDVRAAMRIYSDALGGSFLFGGDNHEQGFRFAQFRFPNGGKIELVTPLGDGFVKRFLDTRGEGVHHVTLKVPDIVAALADLERKGVPVMRVSIDHADWKEAFIHPRDASGTLVQIAQSSMDDDAIARHHLDDHPEGDHRHIRVEDL